MHSKFFIINKLSFNLIYEILIQRYEVETVITSDLKK